METKLQFGTDGIRGVAFKELTPSHAYRIGASVAKLTSKRILLLKDTRESGEVLALSTMIGILASGKDVNYIGVAPTPLASYALRYLDYEYAIVITASHNPYYDNGLKVMGNNGRKITHEIQLQIEKDLESDPQLSLHSGMRFRDLEVKERYLDYLKSGIEPLDDITVLLDVANGATYELAKKVYTELKATTYVINNNPDGRNINSNCGSTCVDKVARSLAIKAIDYDLGFSYDGDGDRVIAFTKDGTLIDGDKIIYLLITYLSKYQNQAIEGVVLTTMSDLGLIKRLEEMGIDVVITDVGDSNVLEGMNSSGYVLGGEKSGHIIYSPKLESGDGIYVSLLLSDFYKRDPDLFSSLLKGYPLTFNESFDIETSLASLIILDPLILETTKRLNSELTKVVIRKSGTESKIRVKVQSLKEAEFSKVKKEVRDLIERLREKYVWDSRDFILQKS